MQDLEQSVEETEFQLQLNRDAAKQDIERLNDEIIRIQEAHLKAMERLA